MAVAIIVAMAVIVLSVFNGYERLLLGEATPFDADLLIKPTKGSYFHLTELPLPALLADEAITTYTPILKGEAMLAVGDQYQVAKLVGFPSSIARLEGIDTLLYRGEFALEEKNVVLGNRLYLALGLPYVGDKVELILPRRGVPLNPLLFHRSIHRWEGAIEGILAPGSEQNDQTLFMSIETLRELLHLTPDEVSEVGLTLCDSKGKKLAGTKQRLQQLLGEKYSLLDFREQHPELLRLVSIEKLFATGVLAFVLLLAGFNLLSSASLLLLEKERDRRLYKALGASRRTIRSLFVLHNMGITLVGALGGFLLGLGLVSLQDAYGFATMQVGITSIPYPVSLRASDLLLLFTLVLFLSFLAAWLPARIIIREKDKK